MPWCQTIPSGIRHISAQRDRILEPADDGNRRDHVAILHRGRIAARKIDVQLAAFGVLVDSAPHAACEPAATLVNPPARAITWLKLVSPRNS